MNTFFKITIFSALVVLLASQIGCGVYYDPFYGDGWIVEEEIVVVESVGYFSSERLTFEIKWNESGYNPDLIATLLTPYAALIEDGGPEMDGCYFLGTYQESYTQMVSMIECVDPFHGLYDLEIQNIGYVTRYPEIKVIKEYRDHLGVTQQVSTQNLVLHEDDVATLHYNF